jgi:hypothetical protein
VLDRDGNLCVPAVISRRRPFYLCAPLRVFKPVCAPSLITLLLSIMAFNYTCS